MHIRINEPKALPELVAALNERVQYVVEQTAPDTVAVSVLGSFADGGERELKQFLAEWRSGRSGLEVELERDERHDLSTPLPERRERPM